MSCLGGLSASTGAGLPDHPAPGTASPGKSLLLRMSKFLRCAWRRAVGARFSTGGRLLMGFWRVKFSAVVALSSWLTGCLTL